ncbi:hypothetical protein ENUP19_0163G0014 [Entamoeba nuttalli]|uniref:Uncharacterized protein n=2 Tax=Entamoeba nuttalli TaxID=412467 RepID=K2GHY3_ENTNP|nr:hypothetical protein ENU1_023790 [Entamoeba nuttalli P19]EKE42361.1 hypothetical protein ENU1_023790 [Entamoeba nuttalli P19]|eukprot:XP_008855310.1 hypothetical protein ENU1_023790 [Entamoeba nuttalli P19]
MSSEPLHKVSDSQRLAERYQTIRDYLAYQQAVLIALLNKKYDIVVERATKKSIITRQVVKVIQVSIGKAQIDVLEIINKRCKALMEIDIYNGVVHETAYRRFITNKSIENHHFLIDLLENEGYFFNSSYSSGKNNSKKMQTVLQIFKDGMCLLNKEDITKKGISLSNYLSQKTLKEKSFLISKNDPILSSML